MLLTKRAQVLEHQQVKQWTFVITPPEQRIRILYTPAVSLIDLLSVFMNGASFYLAFCPAALLLIK